MDAKGNIYNMVYDDLGRIISRTGTGINPEGTTTYEYYKDQATGCNNNTISKLTGPNGVVKEYTFDALKRPATEKITVDGTNYITSFTYDQYGNLYKTTYPSGVEIVNTNEGNGYLQRIDIGEPSGTSTNLFWIGNMNGSGQYTSYDLGNGLTTIKDYYFGIPTRFRTSNGTIQDMNFSFNYISGTLSSRNDAIKNKGEYFEYDNLNRLIKNRVWNGGNPPPQIALTYDNNAGISKGNIATKTDAGYFTYSNTKLHAVAFTQNQPLPGNPIVSPVPNSVISQTDQLISYTPFLKAASVSEGAYLMNFTYGPDQERVKTELKTSGVVTETRYYFGNYEKQVKNGVTREIHYVSDGNELIAIVVKENGLVTPYYVYTDYLGSILTVTDAAGNGVADRSYDAWGRRRDPRNWNTIYSPTSIPSGPEWLYRGFTGHEMLPHFALINMNGRIYDPVLGRMLSPDNNVATPFGTQGYNRYSYAMNNPLSYVDPDGNNPLLFILMAAVKGAAIATATYAVTNLITGNSWNNRDWLNSMAIAAVGGGLGGAFSLLGQAIGPFGQSLTYGLMQNLATQFGVNAAFGGQITLTSVLSAAAGGLIDGAIPQFKGFRFEKYNFGAGLVNALSELAINSARGTAIGAYTAFMSGESVSEGARNGAIGGFVRTGINIAILGPAIRPPEKIRLALQKIERDKGIKLISGAYSPTYRIGGLWQRGLTIGRSAEINDNWRGINNVNVWVEESFHYYQQLTYGWASQFAKGFYEQWILSTLFGKEVYSYRLYGNKYNESEASNYVDNIFPYLK